MMNYNHYLNTQINPSILEKLMEFDGEPEEMAVLFDNEEIEDMASRLYKDGISYHSEVEEAEDPLMIDRYILIGDYVRNILAYMISAGYVDTKETTVLMHYARLLS